MIPRVLKNWKLYVDGQGYSGVVEEVELPEIVIKMETFRGGGMDAESEQDMGIEPMTAKFTFSEYMSEIILKLGVSGRYQLRGALQANDGPITIVVVEMASRMKKFTPGSWKAGEKVSPEYEVTVDYFRWNQGGQDLIEIDAVNMVRKIGGIDQLAGIRDALGD